MRPPSVERAASTSRSPPKRPLESHTTSQVPAPSVAICGRSSLPASVAGVRIERRSPRSSSRRRRSSARRRCRCPDHWSRPRRRSRARGRRSRRAGAKSNASSLAAVLFTATGALHEMPRSFERAIERRRSRPDRSAETVGGRPDGHPHAVAVGRDAWCAVIAGVGGGAGVDGRGRTRRRAWTQRRATGRRTTRRAQPSPPASRRCRPSHPPPRRKGEQDPCPSGSAAKSLRPAVDRPRPGRVFPGQKRSPRRQSREVRAPTATRSGSARPWRADTRRGSSPAGRCAATPPRRRRAGPSRRS